MELKVEENDHVVFEDGKPVCVNDGGKGIPLDAPGVRRLYPPLDLIYSNQGVRTYLVFPKELELHSCQGIATVGPGE